MIKHIVMRRSKEWAGGGAKRENTWVMQWEPERLLAPVPQVRRLETGISGEESLDECNIMVRAGSDTGADLRRYLSHPVHLTAGESIRKLRAYRYAIDYEVRDRRK